jgi:hypothetical protein
MGSALALLLACLANIWMGSSSDWISLDSVEAWRGNTGDWVFVGDAMLKADDPAKLSTKPGAGTMVNGPVGRTANLMSEVEFGDVEAHVEFMVPKGSNSGVYFQGRYEIQVFDSWGASEPKFSDCGGIYQRYDEEQKRGWEGRAPRVNASKAPGEWQSFEVVFRAPRFDAAGRKTANALFVKVIQNGIVIHENVEVTGPTRAAAFRDEKPLGPLMLQGDHGPVAYRNVRIRPAEAQADGLLRTIRSMAALVRRTALHSFSQI